MESLEELEKKYKELGEEIERLKKAKDTGRVAEGEKYYYIDSDGDIYDTDEDNDTIDDDYFKFGNYFKTYEEAKKVVEKIIIYTELKRLAERLNAKNPVDWTDSSQDKIHLYYDHVNDIILTNCIWTQQKLGVIHCTDINFLDIALKEIGKDRLLKLFKD